MNFAHAISVLTHFDVIFQSAAGPQAGKEKGGLTEKQVEAYNVINKFLSTFIDHVSKDIGISKVKTLNLAVYFILFKKIFYFNSSFIGKQFPLLNKNISNAMHTDVHTQYISFSSNYLFPS